MYNVGDSVVIAGLLRYITCVYYSLFPVTEVVCDVTPGGLHRFNVVVVGYERRISGYQVSDPVLEEAPAVLEEVSAVREEAPAVVLAQVSAVREEAPAVVLAQVSAVREEAHVVAEVCCTWKIDGVQCGVLGAKRCARCDKLQKAHRLEQNNQRPRCGFVGRLDDGEPCPFAKSATSEMCKTCLAYTTHPGA